MKNFQLYKLMDMSLKTECKVGSGGSYFKITQYSLKEPSLLNQFLVRVNKAAIVASFIENH